METESSSETRSNTESANSQSPSAEVDGGQDDDPGSLRLPVPASPPTEKTEEAPGLLSRLLGFGAAKVGELTPEDESSLGPAFRDSSPAELAMVTNILRLRDLRVEDVMTPRADVVGVEENAPLEEVIAASEKGSHSRLPIYRETLDDPRGFVHMKDLALNYGFGRSAADFKLSDHMRTALFVPPSMRIAALLQKMQGERVHMALVIDEFGGVDGLITIEDLVEQIVGDIEDEHDREDVDEWTREADGTWLVQA
ncbi:MAG: CBS domain-containing protein, partial [Pseudomonadota bacterium]